MWVKKGPITETYSTRHRDCYSECYRTVPFMVFTVLTSTPPHIVSERVKIIVVRVTDAVLIKTATTESTYGNYETMVR